MVINKWFIIIIIIIVALSRLRQEGLPRSFILNIYKALFEPAVFYCIVVWGSTYGNVLNKVQIMQNDALRAILGVSRRSSVRNFMKSNLLLNVRQMYRYQAGCFVYRSLHKQIDSTDILKWEPLVPSTHGLRRDNLLNVVEVSASASYVSRGPQASAAKVWNSIPLDIQRAQSLSMFKAKYRVHLVNEA